MQDVHSLLPLLDAAKTCLIRISWERHEKEWSRTPAREPERRHTRTTSVIHAAAKDEADAAATAVLCQLMDLSRLRRLLRAALAQGKEEDGRSRLSSSPLLPAMEVRAHAGRPRTPKVPQNAAEALRYGDAVSAAGQRYRAVLQQCDVTVQTLCGLGAAKKSGSEGDPPDKRSVAHPLFFPVDTATDEVDVVDVFFALVLYTAIALCWQQEQQRQQQQQQQRLWTSPGTAPHTRGSNGGESTVLPSSSSAAMGGSVSSVVRAYYNLDPAVDPTRECDDSTAAATATAPKRDCRSVLRRLLPLLERHLPLTELWRNPSLLAALDMMARGVWAAQTDVHAPPSYANTTAAAAATPFAPTSPADAQRTNSNVKMARQAGRCPLCYAAALDDGLAVEMLLQLNHYYRAYHGAEALSSTVGMPHTDSAGVTPRKREDAECTVKYGLLDETQSNGWVAACRVALWNDCRASLTRLVQLSTPPWVDDSSPAPLVSSPPLLDRQLSVAPPSSSCAGFSWRRHAPSVLRRLWVRWWQAELSLARCSAAAASSVSFARLEALVGRTGDQRARSTNLFYTVMLPAVGHACDPRRATPVRTRQVWTDTSPAALLQWLLGIPLTFEDPPVQAVVDGEAMAEAPAVAGRGEPGALLERRHEEKRGTRKVIAGTLLHWLCAHGDVVFLHRLLRQASTSDTPSYAPSPALQQQPRKSEGAAVGAATWQDSNEDASALRGLKNAKTGGAPAASAASLQQPSQPPRPHVVRLDALGSRDNDAEFSSNTPLDAYPSSQPTAHLLQNVPSHNRMRLLSTLQLRDSAGRTALDVACAYQQLRCVRRLLQAGLSPNTLSLKQWASYHTTLPLPLLRLLYDPSVLDGEALCNMRHSPASNGTAPLASSQGSLAERLRRTRCPAAAARTLAQLAYRLWKEKVQHVSCADVPGPQSQDEPPSVAQHPQQQELASSGFSLTEWCGRFCACQTARDRVLRPALAALDVDPHEPLARLVIVAVLTRTLKDWLCRVPPWVRTDDVNDAPPRTSMQHRPSASPGFSLRELRQQHTVALRLYTQLTCPLGRAVLQRAVEVRWAICAAVELREERAAALLLASSRAAPLTAAVTTAASADPTRSIEEKKNREEGGNGLEPHDPTKSPLAEAPSETDALLPVKDPPSHLQQPQGHETPPLPPSEAATAHRELRLCYCAVLAEAQQLDALLAAEQRRISLAQRRTTADAAATTSTTTTSASAAEQRQRPKHNTAATVLTEPLPHPTSGWSDYLPVPPSDTSKLVSQDTDENSGKQYEPAYVLVVVPSAMVLQKARYRPTPPTSAADATALTSPSRVSYVEPTLWCPAQTPRQVWVRLPQHVDLDALLREHDGGAYGVVAQDMPLTAPVQRGDLITFRHRRSTATGEEADGPSHQKDARWGTRGGGSAPPQFVALAIFSEPRTVPYLVLQPSSRTAPAEETRPQSTYEAPPSSLELPYVCLTAHGNSGDSVSRHLTLDACCLSLLYHSREESRDASAATEDPLDWLSVRAAAASPADVLTVLRTRAEFVSRWARMVWGGVQPCWLARVPPGGDPLDAAGVAVRHVFATEDRTGDAARATHGERSVLTVLPSHATVRGESEDSVMRDWPTRADGDGGAADADVVVSWTF